MTTNPQHMISVDKCEHCGGRQFVSFWYAGDKYFTAMTCEVCDAPSQDE